MRLVLIQGVSELLECASVTRQLSGAITSDEAFSSPPSFVPFRHDKTKQINSAAHLHLRTDTHCDDDCSSSDAPNQLIEIANKQQKEEPRCWPVREMEVPKDKVGGWNCAVGDFLGKPRWPFPGGQHLFSGWRMGPNLAAPLQGR